MKEVLTWVTNAASLCQIKMKSIAIMTMVKLPQIVVLVIGDNIKAMIAGMAVECKCKLIKALLRVSNTENLIVHKELIINH